MKPFILIVSIFLITSIQLSAQRKETDLATMGLKGKVKSIVQRSEHFARKRFWDSAMYVFNKQGNIAVKHHYGRVRGLDIKIQYEYDKESNIIIMNCFDSAGVFQYKIVDEFDRDHRLIKNIWYDFDGSPGGIDSFTYDNKGNKIEAITYNSDSSLKYKSVFKYAGNKKIEESYYETEGFKWKTKYAYDEKGNVLEEHWLGKNDSLLRKLVNKYNDKNLKIVEDWHNPDGNVYKTVYTYDSLGSLVVKDWYGHDGKLSTTTRYMYQVDKKNNWIKITTLSAEGTPVSVIERQIEYF